MIENAIAEAIVEIGAAIGIKTATAARKKDIIERLEGGIANFDSSEIYEIIRLMEYDYDFYAKYFR